MRKKLDCPVCSYGKVEDNTCPKCGADLSLLQMLAEITPTYPTTSTNRRLLVSLLIVLLLLGIGLGVGAYSLLSKPAEFISLNSSPVPTQSSPLPKTFLSPPSEQNLNGFRYKVRSGDSLSIIAKRLYGDGNLWTLIIQANPSIKDRVENLKVGEILIIPNLEGRENENNSGSI